MEEKYWVALSTHPKIGARSLIKLYKYFNQMERVWRASRKDLEETGLDRKQIEAVMEVIAKVSPEKEIEKINRLNIKTITIASQNYPALLKEIPDPPGVLYLKGEMTAEDEIALAVVGSRSFTSYGRQVVDKLVDGLAKNKITIISGLALGIDTLAHRAALESGGRTIGVLGCGLDQIYPVANVRLADKIISGQGAIISEFPLGTPAYRSNFPMRNRIIAGMSLGTLVVEGALESGSLITARAALDYNREVFAVPGSIFSETSEGPNRLIQMGAKPVFETKDILTELDLIDNLAETEARQIIPDSPNEEILLKLLKKPLLVDELIKKSKLSPQVINSTLTILEIKGAVTNLGGTRFVIRGKLKEN